MPNCRLSMRKIREILRMRFLLEMPYEAIGKSCGISVGSVSNYLEKADKAGLKWPLPENLDDNELEIQLFPGKKIGKCDKSLPDWAYVFHELKKKGVTKRLLWEEFKEDNPDGVQYSQFCDKYSQWLKTQHLIFRATHLAGDRTFVDFAGKTIPIYMEGTETVLFQAQIFVAVLGASQYSYAIAVPSQDLSSWIQCHVKAFEFFGGVTRLVVPDNLKSGVKKACRYDPDINPTYSDLADHYDFGVMPARVKKPRDKACAEIGVCLTTRWILAVLRNQKFYNLHDLNIKIRELLIKLNSRPFQKKKEESRKSLFEKIDKPALKPLPASAYEYAIIRKARVGVDYHVAIDSHHYSVPFQLAGKEVIVRLTSSTVEIIYKNQRIASHMRSFVKWGFSTIKEHRPKSHQKYLEWNPDRFVRWAESIGPATAEFIKGLIASYEHVEQSYSRCLGIFRLGFQFGKDRLEGACQLACQYKQFSYQTIKAILKNKKEIQITKTNLPVMHTNIRGGSYYI
ncbi:MAG: IS21 family transposase [Oligoflexales bacterium]|nr:IS21 family transposase [Oligoflexales bacterium]